MEVSPTAGRELEFQWRYRPTTISVKANPEFAACAMRYPLKEARHSSRVLGLRSESRPMRSLSAVLRAATRLMPGLYGYQLLCNAGKAGRQE